MQRICTSRHRLEHELAIVEIPSMYHDTGGGAVGGGAVGGDEGGGGDESE